MNNRPLRLFEAAVRFDHLTFGWCQQRVCRNALIAISRQVSRTADGYLYLLFAVVAFAEQYCRLLVTSLMAFVLERLIYFLVKNRIRRNRPPDSIPGFSSVIQAADKFSFPSGHTSAAFLMAALLYSQFPATAWFMYPWACCVAGSRVMLGVHFPTDTLAGAVLGTCSGIACLLFLQPDVFQLIFSRQW